MPTTTIPDAVEQYVLRPIDIDRDAEKLAEMWNASDDQWPGTWTHGVPFTAQRVREWFAREHCVEALIWDTGDAIAGYCSLWELPDEANVTYIATLNVAPHYQKLSLARKFLTHYVERAIELGSVRLDLSTWPGNLKAVPLYKKCGFFWLPGTGVQMLNFLPTILRMPVARPYFARHDWYRTFQRELSQAEDDERWEGMKVFTYRFEEDGDRLVVWVDRGARSVTAVETNDFFAAAIADDIEPPRGMPALLRWRIGNTSDRDLEVSLIVNGTRELMVERRETRRLAPGETITLEAPVEVAADAAEVKEDKPVPAVQSLLIVDGQVLELGTGFRPRPAIEVSTDPEHITLAPGVPQTVQLQLHSRLAWDTEATISIAPEHSLSTDWTEQRLTLAARGYSAIPVRLQATEAGTWQLPISISFDHNGKQVRLPASQQTIFALPLGGVLGARGDGNLRLENERVRLVVEQEGGGIGIFDRATGKWLAYFVGWAGPPIWPSEFSFGDFDLRVEQHADRVVAVAAMASKEHPDFFLRKRITFNAGPVFTVEYDWENLGPDRRQFQLIQSLSGSRSETTLTLPFVHGLGQGLWEEFPGSPDDALKKAANYAEQWAALDRREATVGVIWGNDLEELDWGWGMQTLGRLYDCPPQSRVHPAATHFYVGAGDWRTVRQVWQRLSGQPSEADTVLPEPRAPLAASVEPGVVVAASDAARADLLIQSLLSRKLSGKVTLELPEGWQAGATGFDIVDLYWQQPFRAGIDFRTEAQPGPAAVRIQVRSEEWDGDWELPLVRLGDGRAVEVRQHTAADQEIFTIDNGRMQIDIAPRFAATISAIREGGADHLLSPFPNAGVLGWMNQWYGGVMPIIMLASEHNFPGKLWQEHFAAEPITGRDGQGITWHGLRQRTTLKMEQLEGLAVEIDTLTTGGSPVIKQLLRLFNPTPVARRLGTFGFSIFVQPDGSRTHTVLWGPNRQLKPSERTGSIITGGWAAAQNPETGRAVGLIAPSLKATIASWGSDGNHLQLQTYPHVPANGSTELLAYLVLADDIDQVKSYAALKDLK